MAFIIWRFRVTAGRIVDNCTRHLAVIKVVVPCGREIIYVFFYTTLTAICHLLALRLESFLRANTIAAVAFGLVHRLVSSTQHRIEVIEIVAMPGRNANGYGISYLSNIQG